MAMRVLFSLVVCFVSATASAITIDEFIQELEKSRSEFVRDEQGWEIQYRVDQSRENYPDIPYPRKLEGAVRLQWPNLYVNDRCDMTAQYGSEYGIKKDFFREATYNFDGKFGYMREGNLIGQKCSHRPNLTYKMAFPLSLQYFDIASEKFGLGNPEVASTVWLPGCLAAAEYTVGEQVEVVDGIECLVVRFGTKDKMCFAESLGFALVTREYSLDGLNKEVYRASMFRDIGLKMKFPYRMSFQSFASDGKSFSRDVKVTKLVRGNLKPSSFEIEIPEDIQVMEDHFANTRVTRQSKSQPRSDVVLEAIKAREKSDNRSRNYTLAIALVLVLVPVLVYLSRIRR